MSYTIIGCGDFYNQDREPVWCPWTQKAVDSYTIHVIGDPDAAADFTHLADFAAYLVASLCKPEKSHNAHLNFISDTISHSQIAALLGTYSKKPVHKQVLQESEMHEVIADPEAAPKELKGASALPVDFWFLVKGCQGQGRFRWPQGQRHDELFPDVEKTSFEEHFRQRF